MKKILLAVLIISLILYLTIIFVWKKNIEIIEINNGFRTAKGKLFEFEDIKHKKLDFLRNRENLLTITASSKNEFEKILKICDWTNRQFEPSTPDPYPPWDAVEILNWIRDGQTGGFCAQYAFVFVQSLTSIGIPARYVDIAGKDSGAHFTAEVWSTDYNKWVLIDPADNIYFKKDAKPLSGLELHKALVTMNYKDIEVVRISNSSAEKSISEAIKIYYKFAVLFRNNHLSRPPRLLLKTNKKFRKLIWHDKMLLWEDNHTKELSDTYRERPGIKISSDESEFYWEPDIIYIEIIDTDKKNGTLTLQFNGLLNKHDTFYISEDTSDTWTKTSSVYAWKLKNRYNRLTLRADNPDNSNIESFIIVIYPKKDIAHSELIDTGRAYYKTGRYEKSIKMYKKYLSIDPDNYMTYVNIGDAYTALGKYSKAVDAYKNALLLNNKCIEAKNRLDILKEYIKDNINPYFPEKIY